MDKVRTKTISVFVLMLVITACSVTVIETQTPETIVEKTMADRSSLSESIRKATEDTAASNEIDVTLQVSGGAPAEGYFFLLQVSGDGSVTYEYYDKLISDEEYSGEANLQGDVVALIEKILKSGVLEQASTEPHFAPGTTVGKLEITDGTSRYHSYFAADMEQAESQGKVPPPELMEIIEVLYELGNEFVTGTTSVKP